MKTIATAAVLMMLSAPTWADDAEKNEANSNEPIVLSEAEMDGVTAGTATIDADIVGLIEIENNKTAIYLYGEGWNFGEVASSTSTIPRYSSQVLKLGSK